MKRAKRTWIVCTLLIGCLLAAASLFHTRHVYAWQSDQDDYDDGTFYISSSVDVDSGNNLYLDSYMEVEFDDYEDVDEIELDAYADQDGSTFDSASGYGDDYTPIELTGTYDAVSPGHEYGLESDGYACYDDDGEGDCGWEYIGQAYAQVYVDAPPPVITGINPSSVYQGDQGTLTVTGTNLIQSAGDQLTLNVLNGTSPFTTASAPSATTATFSYDFSGYPVGTYSLYITNNEGSSEPVSFTVLSPVQTFVPPVDPCAVASTSNPQLGYTSIVPTATPGGSGTLTVSFSGADFSAVTATVNYGPSSTPQSIAASIAAVFSRSYYRYGLSAKAFGSSIIYSGNTTLGTVNNGITGPSFTTTNSTAAAAQAENACRNAPTPPKSAYAVAYASYIPVDHVLGPDTCIVSGGSLPTQLIYNGNGFRNSYKTTQALTINFLSTQASGYFGDTGLTTNYGDLSPRNGSTLSSQDDDAVYYDKRSNTGTADCYLRNAVGKADPSGWSHSASVSSSAASVYMHGESQNPLSYPIGSIKWTITTHIDVGSNTGYAEYLHTCYPAHQVKVSNTTLYLYTPPSNNLTYIGNCLTGIFSPIAGMSPSKGIH